MGQLPVDLGWATVGTVKMVVAACGAGLLSWDWILRRSGATGRGRRLRDGGLVVLGTLGALCWTNLFQFHFGSDRPLQGVHVRDVLHNYLGSKYFAELGYTGLYECIAVVELEMGHRARVARRTYRNLETNRYEKPVATLEDPARCTDRFSAERWAGFREDVAWFRTHEPDWDLLQLDWGYNWTPVATMVGRVFASTAGASSAQIWLLTFLDSGLALLMWASVWWAFGWRTLCVGLVFWGTWLPADYVWTGGALLRRDWIFCTIVGVCLLRRGWSGSAGAVLLGGALLKVVPALAPAGIALAVSVRTLRKRRLVVSVAQRRAALGGLLAAFVLLPLAALTAGGAGAWLGFVENSRIDSQPSPNNMGAKTLLSYRHDSRWEALEQTIPSFATASDAWTAARHSAYAQVALLHVALVLAFLVLLALAVERSEDWVAGVLGLAVMPVMFELSNYYYEAFVVFALLWPRFPGVGAGLCALSAATWGLVLFPALGFEASYALASFTALVFATGAVLAVYASTRANQ